MATLWVLAAAFAMVSCSQSNDSGGAGGSGGSASNGGSGGASPSGGTTSSSGGSASSGGSVGSGGTTATGDGSSSGGAAGHGSGGTAETGGSTTAASGGKVGSGGVTERGGAGAGGTTSSKDASVDGPGGGATGGDTGAGGSGTGGAAGLGGTTGAGGGAGGAVDCAGRAISLGANGTGSESDSAYAHVEVDMKNDLPVGNAKRTVEFWAFIKTTDWVGEKNQVYYYGDGSGANTSFGLDFGTNAVSGSPSNHATLNPFTGSDIRDDSGKDLGITSSTDQWVHIAMTWDGAALVTYVNGVAKITVQAGGGALNTKTSNLMLGCNPTNNNCFSGLFDELRVWNVARSASEIKDNYEKPLTGNEAGLVGYWKFDEESGTTAADAVSSDGHNPHAGTLKADSAANNPTFVVPTKPLPLVCP